MQMNIVTFIILILGNIHHILGVGIGDVLVCCSPDNEGSKRTILHCGGVLDAAETDPKYNLPINRYKFLKE